MTQFHQNFDHCKSYKTIETLYEKLNKFDDFHEVKAIPMIIPYGKNQYRYTAIINFNGGENIHWAHRGYIVLG